MREIQMKEENIGKVRMEEKFRYRKNGYKTKEERGG